MLEREFLIAALLLPVSISAYDFRADGPKEIKSVDIEEPKKNTEMFRSKQFFAASYEAGRNVPLPIFFTDGASMVSESDMENLKRFAAANDGKTIAASVFYGSDRTLGLERLRVVKKALLSAGFDNSRLMLMPIKDELKDGMAELKVFAE